MDIQKLEVGKKYVISHAYGQPNQIIKVLSVKEETSEKWGKYWEAIVEYVSDDATKGMITRMNTIECKRYLREVS